MTEADVKAQIASLQKDVADLNGTVRVTKHEIANLQHVVNNGLGPQMDKIEAKFEKVDNRIERFEEKVGGKLDQLVTDIASINVKHERGAGFFAGITFMVTASGGLLLVLGKLLFGGHL